MSEANAVVAVREKGNDGKKEESFFSSVSALPELVAIHHGGCGANAALDMMKQLDPALYPHLRFLVIESNSHVLNNHFSQNGRPATESLLTHWFEVGQVKIIQLGKGLGAGGDPKVGEALLREKLDEIREFLGAPNAVIQVGGGGGGTASGTMPLMASTLLEMQVPTYSILTVPRLKEGRAKLQKARDVMRKLLELCPTTFVYNEHVVDKSLPYSKIYHQVNGACLVPTIQFLRSLIQDIGDNQDLDINDWRHALKVGNHALPGYFDASNGLEGIQEGLLGNRYLNTKIIKKALTVLFWFDGEWSVNDHDMVLDCVQKQMETVNDDEIEMKWGSREEGAPEGHKSVGFVAFAKEAETPYLEDEEETKVQVALPASLLEFGPVKAHAGEDDGGKTTKITGIVGGEQRTAFVTPDLAVEFGELFTKNLGIKDAAWALGVQARVASQTGFVFDAPIPRGAQNFGRPNQP
jgi:cell division protein FtsZ